MNVITSIAACRCKIKRRLQVVTQGHIHNGKETHIIKYVIFVHNIFIFRLFSACEAIMLLYI